MRIFATAVILLTIQALVLTQISVTQTAACTDQTKNTTSGVSYQIKCGECSSITQTVTISGASLTDLQTNLNSMCASCKNGKTGSNKTCTITVQNSKDTSVLANCYDYSSTCGSRIMEVIALAIASLLSAVLVL